ncbi:MAG: DoxX family membrane protein [Deltaproteobacteria bacterium]|nr:DoxX family membrane protein [Deltaproteobacteria bacterium]
MKKILDNVYLVLALRVGFGVMFLFAGVPKIVDPAAFAIGVDNYHMLPNALVNLFAIALPWVEVAIGVLLIAGVFTEAAALVSLVLCVMFTVALAQAITRGLDISCGCFSVEGGEKVSPVLLLRDLLLILGSAWIMFFNRGRAGLLCLVRGNR